MEIPENELMKLLIEENKIPSVVKPTMDLEVLRIVKSLNKQKLIEITNDLNLNILSIVRSSKKKVDIGVYDD